MAEATVKSGQVEGGLIHTSKVKLRWSDFDRFGHVNNAAYIELAHEARAKFAADGFGSGELEELPAVFIRHLEVDYLRPILPDTEVVEVDTQVTYVGKTSFATTQRVKDRFGKPCCVIICTQVLIDMATGMPRPIRNDEKAILLRGK
ncbi:acyl-CoA thioesterase [Corynebacterium freiburgense]|uniref:acyl-CoA thioesterase n=1 Tax=Corynebacterium freiburgense TaxID=556548 RepID=UPI000429C5CC|nr:acyl-CoA thioesterase [Corynebacterium freiburgense]WJZ03439.1 Thioesterase superfamily protein [Corynebacterium freiburgense]